MSKKIVFLFTMIIVLLLSACKPENVIKLVNLSPSHKKQYCLINVWPASPDSERLTERKARKFLKDVEAPFLRYVQQGYYKSLKLVEPPPSACRTYLKYSELDKETYRKQCLKPWAEKTQKYYFTTKGICSANITYAVGGIIKPQRDIYLAELWIINMKNTNLFANKEDITAKGKNLDRLAEDVASKIKRLIK